MGSVTVLGNNFSFGRPDVSVHLKEIKTNKNCIYLNDTKKVKYKKNKKNLK